MTTKSWQKQLQQAISTPCELLRQLAIEPERIEYLDNSPFKMKVPLAFVRRMKKGDPNCPLLRQVLPLRQELDQVDGFVDDPLLERKANKLPGLLHKYHGRVLVTLATQCGVNCRYCFRRHFPYQENNVGQQGWLAIYHYLKQHDDVHEVILSGGDPLLLSNTLLARFIDGLSDIASVKTLRIHSRMPIVLPARVDSGLVDLLAKTRLHCVLVTHSNHANEIDDSVGQVLKSLIQQGVHVLNQAVLLQGINDNVDALVDLSFALFDAGIMPYYLHLLDKISGAAHFDVDKATGIKLMHKLRQRVPGYLVPKLAKEEAGQGSKTHIC